MAKGRLMMAFAVLACCGLASVKAQSKKEVIQLLSKQVDSLQKALHAREESTHQLEVKLARIEGAAEVNSGLIKRMESKTDSLREALIARNGIIENQKAQLAKLTADVSRLQNQEKEWSTKNEALLAELKTFKDKAEPAIAAAKEAKVVAEAPKEAAKPAPAIATAATTPVNKTEPQ
ncbi:hypothetical protein KHS38_07800 [Mucilaginibacter sp. Bleaf8]|uniref:hypothetical protein n=1 Tax=Mucilaginibacter sp. Bleaf8 TaxID=2834430 RepID=UPI001BD19AFF|nr:hypothetical protein [Mucilaginibacter sp. Bleaf8]MBS7564306.1 hypothetical protein [Mucilaginibacter sp. Bleaf8]